MIGQLTTSFLQGKVSPTMTSTTSSQCAEPVMAGSKTECCNESLGAIQDTPSNRGYPKQRRGGMPMGRALNDLLPYSMRPIKARRRRMKPSYGWGAELYTFKRVWHSHYKPRMRALLATIVGNK